MTVPGPPAGGATSAYEQWVRALRSWQEDPGVRLSDLPKLDDQALPPAAWDRFMGHLHKALEGAMRRWQEAFVTSLTRESDEFRRGSVMVDARRTLAKRLLLGRHPGLPEKLRDAVWDVIAENVASAQAQLEEVALRGDGGVDPARANRDLTFFRTHSLTVILAPGFPLEAFANGQHAAPAAPHSAATQVASGQQPYGSLPLGLSSSRPRTIRF